MKFKFLIKLLKGPIKALLIRELKKEDNKEFIIDLVNVKLDIPKLSEAEEEKLLDAVYTAATEALAVALDRV